MTKEEQMKIVKEAELLFMKKDMAGAKNKLQPLYMDFDKNGGLDYLDNTIILMTKVLMANKEFTNIVSGLINQLSLSNDIKSYYQAMEMGASVERENYGKSAAYEQLGIMKREWLERNGNNSIDSYYDSKISVLFANYTMNDDEKVALLKSVIEKGFDSDKFYREPNDVYVTANRLLARTYLYNGKREDAIKVCDNFLKDFADDFNILFYKSQALLEIGNLDDAKALIGKIDTTKVKDKRFLARVESLKTRIEKNITTISEIKEEYFNNGIKIDYVDGKILPVGVGMPGKGGGGGGTPKQPVNVDEKMVIDYMSKTFPQNISVSAELGSDHFNGYWLFSFSGENAGNLENYVVLNKFKDGNATFVVHKDLELNFIETTKGELVAKRDEENGKIAKLNHGKKYESRLKELLEGVSKKGDNVIEDFNEVQRKQREKKRKSKKIASNPTLVAEIEALRDKIKAAREYRAELLEARKAETARSEKSTWTELISEQDKEIKSLEARKKELEDRSDI